MSELGELWKRVGIVKPDHALGFMARNLWRLQEELIDADCEVSWWMESDPDRPDYAIYVLLPDKEHPDGFKGKVIEGQTVEECLLKAWLARFENE